LLKSESCSLFAVLTAAVLAIIAIDASNPVMAAAYTPATFVEGKHSLNTLLDFPKVDGDVSVAVICTSIGTANGRIREAKCSAANDPSQKFAIAVNRRVKSARINPATVDGREEKVDFQFTVIFSRTGDAESIDVYINNQKNLDRFGPDYISAQRYSPYELPDVCKERRISFLILEVAVVTKEGAVTESDLHVDSAGIPKTCEVRLREITKSSRFIPAFYEGSPVESVWVNPWIATAIDFRGQ
jgi:hypothetical protein